MNEHRTETAKKSIKDTFYTLCYDGVPTTEVTGEFTLPDYLPDTRRLLRCSATPEITGKFRDGDKMEFEGNVHVTVVYMAEDGTAQVFATTLPFTQSVPMPPISENSVISVHCVTESAQCRLSGPRKMHLRIRVKMPCRVLTETTASPTVATADGKPIPVCMQRKTLSGCHIAMSEVVTRTYAEDIPSGVEDAAIRAILSMQIIPHTTECRISGNEALCAGEFLISALCALTDADGNESCKPLHARIPFSEHLALTDEIAASSAVVPDITLRDIRYAPSDDGTTCALDFSMEASALCMSECECEAVIDAFLPAHDVKAEYAYTNIYHPIRSTIGNFAAAGSISYDGDDALSEVLDTACRINVSSHTQNAGKLTLSGNMEVNAIAVCDGGRYVPIAGTIPFTWDTDLGTRETPPSLLCQAEAYPTSVICRIDSAEHAIICEAEISMLLSVGHVEEHMRVNTLTVTENSKNTRKGEHPILLYYPEAGESIWDIAKSYHVTPESLLTMNELSPDTRVVPNDRRVLLI